jgi:hypothetical protein
VRRADRTDRGAYAILYALLVVVLLAVGALVVDNASVRSDRRLDRSASDSAAVGGAELLGSGSVKAACLKAWAFLLVSLNESSLPANACSQFNAYDTTAAVASYCGAVAAPWPSEISDDRQISGGRWVRVAWPIPYHGATDHSQFLTPDLAPGAATQTFSTAVDGSNNGCDRLGVAIFENESFKLGGALGVSGTATQVHSVARFNPSGGPKKGVAALNLLNTGECTVLTTTGGGKVIVDPVVSGSTILGPGVIAVESTGTAAAADYISNCTGKQVVKVSPGGQVCASSVLITLTVVCDGLGKIKLHEMDDGTNDNGSDPTASNTCPNDQLCPVPTAEQGVYGWNPVTEVYGCNTTRLAPCTTPATNYIANLETAFGGPGAPSAYTAHTPYPNPYPGGFTVVNNCSYTSNIPAILPAGNYYFNCSGGLSVTGALIINGGNVVIKNGGLTIGTSGCFIFNAAVTAAAAAAVNGTTCANVATNGTISGSGIRVTTNPAPTHDGILYLRGGSIDSSGTMLMPQVFAYSKAGRLNVGGGPVTLWTAPGAGDLIGGYTRLATDCGAPTTNSDCMASRFSRVVYWSDAKVVSGGSTENKFVASGTLRLVGVFFTPRGSFNFAGTNCLAAQSTQFWADDLTVAGTACVTLKPDAEFSEESPTGQSVLIR